MPKSLSPRALKAKKLVERGMPKSRALREAGFSEAYAHRIGGKGSPLRAMMDQAAERFMNEYAAEAERIGFTGKFAARRLYTAASRKGEKADFNAIAAIKTHGQTIRSAAEKNSNISPFAGAVLIIPGPMTPEAWESKAKEYVSKFKPSEVRQVQEAEIIQNAEIEKPNE